MSVTKADLERAKKVEPVDLSEWITGENGTGYVCAISAGNVLKLPEEGEKETLFAWVVNCFCEEDGTLFFKDDADARDFLGKRPFGMVQAICEKAMCVNGLGEAAQQATAKN